MKHLLNNISQEEKNSILEQHQGGMEVITENFQKMVSKKLGDVPTFLNEAKMETCEQCGNELTEGGECMECGSMYEEEMMEQDKKVVEISPEQMKMLHNKGECKCGDVTLKFPSFNQYKKDMMEQTRLLIPDNLKINVRKLNGDPFYTIGLDNRKVKADGDIVKVGGRQIGGDSDGMEMTLKYDCQKDTYRAFHGNGNNFDGMDITKMISPEAKDALKNIKTYCSGTSAGL